MWKELRSRREPPLATLVDKIDLWNFDLKDAKHVLWGKTLTKNIFFTLRMEELPRT
ncbi:MAG TPA: hypothetical protein VI894_03820 [Candidatus Nanoarchaeia archaeon]|nr:hypothetical protein [Candidatus Nanoarchaeia archaeon]